MNIKFGPAGLGSVKAAEKVLEEYHELGLRACEIAFTYSIYIKHKSDAERIGSKARKLGISMSIHAPYWLNLNSSEKEKIEASKKRILDCCEIGEILGVKTVVFHAGFYGKKDKDESYKIIRDNIKDMVEELKRRKLKVKIAPEIMGKVNVFGEIEEIAQLVKDTGCSFCIDFAHILARYKGIDYKKIERLFPFKEWHVHFSGIVYGDKGEKHHRNTEKGEWEELLRNLPKDKDITIICESNDIVGDSVKGLKTAERIL